MSYVKCPKCGERIDLYGKVNDAIGKDHGIPVFDEIPFDQEIAKHMDMGDIENLHVPYLDSTVEAIIKNSTPEDSL